MKKDEEVTRISGIRDNQSNVMIERFKQLISEDRLDDAFSIADEWFESVSYTHLTLPTNREV